MTDLTPEILLRVANKVEPDRVWYLKGGQYAVFKTDSSERYYVPFQDKAGAMDAGQQLRIRDYLAQRGVFLLIAYCDDDKTKAIAWTGDGDNFIAEHDDINVCAVLAVDALEGK